MAPQTRVYKGEDRNSPLIGTKFILITIQTILLFLIIEL